VNPKQTSLERALEEAVSRALRDNLAPLQRTADELHQAYADLVASCASTRPSNALPAMLRAQTAAAALSAGLSVLSNFVALALNPREAGASATAVDEQEIATGVGEPTSEIELEVAGMEARESAAETAATATNELSQKVAKEAQVEHEIELIAEPEFAPEPSANGSGPVAAAEHVQAPAVVQPAVAPPVTPPAAPAFDVSTLPTEMQDLHRRANRVAKVAMQDIKLLRPKDVESGREHKDLCERLRVDLDKARKEYDRRFKAISDHPVDYFHHWMLEILAGGNEAALGEYPYPSAILRH
jgi:hypothetical protein